MGDRILKGVFPVLPTPFDEEGRVDTESLKRLVRFVIKTGAHGIVVLGFMSEVTKLSDAERSIVIRTVIGEVNGNIPVVTGVYHGGSDVTAQLSLEAQELGSDAVMVPPPRLTKPSDDQILQHYKLVSRSVRVPIVIQDEPVGTGVNMSPSLISKISESLDRSCYLKLEDPPTHIKISQVRRIAGERIGIFGGMGGMYFLNELKRGAAGIMTGFSYPEVLVGIYQTFMLNQPAKAAELFYHYLPLINFESTPGISLALRKEILRRRGLLKTSFLRAPSANLDSESLEEIGEMVALFQPNITH